MEIDLQPIMISDVNCTLNRVARPENNNLQIGANTMYRHLTDHDYLHTRPRSQPNKQKKQIKITELKAIYNCTTCGYRTMDRNVLQKHICIKKLKYILHRNDTKKLPKGYEKCSKCNFSAEKSNLINHMELHVVGVERNCTDCIIPKMNIDNYTYQCSMCNYTTQNPTSLKIHMHVHSRGSPYKCTECEFSGTDLTQLIKHYNGVKDLLCKCGYATHVKRQMSVHMRSHTGDKPFSCGICNFSTSDRAGLHRHMKKKHIVE